MKFRQKQFTLSEGRYTGPKDLPDIPGALSVIGKTALAGSAIGGLVGGIMKDSTILEGAEMGGKTGILAGVAAKILLNTLHNPMKKVKFSEVDKNIRARFGMFRASGFVIGDTAERRGKFDEKFVINDREVTNYKINVAIQDDQVRMYTLGLNPEEIKKLDSILDYHCKKYSGMEYTATMIGGKQDGSFSVNITFTNYQVLSGFLMEISDSLMTKINLLDSKAIVENKIWSPEEKEFSSIPRLSKMDVISILTKSGIRLLGVRSASDLATVLLKGVIGIISKMSDIERAMVSNGPVNKEDLQNKFLEKCLKDSGYLEGQHYTVDAKVAPFNMYMYNGNLIMSIAKDSKDYKLFKKQIIIADGVINVNDLGNACLCTKVFNSRKEVPVFLRKLIGVLGIKPNIYLV